MYDQTWSLIYKTIILAILSAVCSMFQNQVALRRARFTDFKTNHWVSFAWKNICSLIYFSWKKFQDRPYNMMLVMFPTWVFLWHRYFAVNAELLLTHQQSSLHSSYTNREVSVLSFVQIWHEFVCSAPLKCNEIIVASAKMLQTPTNL